MKPYTLIPLAILLSGCVINTGTLASGNASGNKANVNAQANTKVETKVDTSVNNQVSTNTNTDVTTTTGVSTNIATKLPGPSDAPVTGDATLVAWLDLELVPGLNAGFNTTGKVEFKFAERPGVTKYKVIVKRIGELPSSGSTTSNNGLGLISDNGMGYKVQQTMVPDGAPTSFEQEGVLPIFSWATPQAGVYAYQAIAFHKSGKTLTSAWIKFTVWAPGTVGGGNVIAAGGGN
ncbi:MAG: hypothetical protein ACK46X_11660 [Candidatus Sericytochromatia bacterium]